MKDRKPGILQSIESQRVGQALQTVAWQSLRGHIELNMTEVTCLHFTQVEYSHL